MDYRPSTTEQRKCLSCSLQLRFKISIKLFQLTVRCLIFVVTDQMTEEGKSEV